MQFHEAANLFPLMAESDLYELAQDISANGLREPVWTHEGKIIDGRNRYRACELADIEPEYREWDGGGSLVAFVVSLNLHRRHLSESQRAMVAAKLANYANGGDRRSDQTANWQSEKVSRTEAAELLNVSERSVNRAATVKEHGTPELIEAVESGEIAVSKAAQIAKQEPEVQQEIVAASRTAPLMTSNSYEWYTPPDIAERVRVVLGEVDLDPCSSAEANQVIAAKKFFSIDDDGLSQTWSGRVFMNPPYGDSIAKWICKLYEEFEAGNITQALALVPARTDTAWFRVLKEYPRCFLQGRLQFGGPGAAGNSATFPSVVIALGCDVSDLKEAFREIGDVYTLA